MSKPGEKVAEKIKAADAKPAGAITGTQVAAKAETSVAVPDYIKQGATRGSENVDTTDVTIPRLELVQALSPCLKKNDPQFIDGAQQGMIFNSLTRELYGLQVTVCPVLFKKEWLLWRSRDEGGGFRGAHPSPEAAALEMARDDDSEGWEAIETAQQIVLVVRADGSTEEAVVSMARTKLKVSRQWNSLIRINGGDRFSRTYTLFGIEEKNSKNQDYYNLGVANGSFAPKNVYLAAEKLYESIASGARKVNVDHSDADTEEAQTSSKGEY